MAISIFEQTSQDELEPEQKAGLTQIFDNDESLHLRRKAAFVLFKFGKRGPEVINRIKEARDNDTELEEIAKQLLTQLDK